MHITALPPHSEAEFLKALTHGANERILDERKSMFPYTDQQAQRFMQVYRDLKCEWSVRQRRSRSTNQIKPPTQLLSHTGVPYYGQGRHSVLPAVAWHISRVMIKIVGRPGAVPSWDEGGAALPRRRRRNADVARRAPPRRSPLLRLLQLAQDIPGAAGEHAAQGARLPP